MGARWGHMWGQSFVNRFYNLNKMFSCSHRYWFSIWLQHVFFSQREYIPLNGMLFCGNGENISTKYA
jgi:hypothetical protein